MESCPAEVLHQICALVDKPDAAALRLTCRSTATIAEHYIVRGQIRFHISADSLKRLEFIANHPVFRQYVTKLCYEANILLPITSVREYSTYFTCGTQAETLPEPPHPDSSLREVRLYRRNIQKWSQGGKALSPKKLQEQYEAYTRTFDSQRQIIAEKSEVKTLAGAVSKFPRLAELFVVNVGRCKHMLSGRFWEQFPDGFRPPMAYDTEITVQQLSSVLRPANKSTLRVLNAKVVSPKILNTASFRTSLVDSFANLHTLFLAFRLDELDYEELDWSDPGQLYRSIRKGRLVEALSHAKQLRDLSIRFDDCCHHPHSFAELKQLLGDHSWKHLKKLDLSRFECTAGELLDTLKRQPKLEHLALACITLTAGSWADALRNMRSELKLKSTDFQGWLQNAALPDEFMILDYIDADSWYDDPECATTLAGAIDMYVTEGYWGGETWDEGDDDYNPATRLEDFTDLEALEDEANREPTESEIELMMAGVL